MFPLNQRQQMRAVRKAAHAEGEDLSPLLEADQTLRSEKEAAIEAKKTVEAPFVTPQYAIGGISTPEIVTPGPVAANETAEEKATRDAENATVSAGKPLSSATMGKAKEIAKDASVPTAGMPSASAAAKGWTPNIPPAV